MDFLNGLLDVFSNTPLWIQILAVVGGLKGLARYTPWTWDDKLFEILEWLPKTVLKIVKK